MPARLPEALLRWSRDASGLGLVRAVLGPAFPSGPPPAGAASTAVVDQAWLIASALDSGPAMRSGTHPARFALSLYDGHADWASGLADLERTAGLPESGMPNAGLAWSVHRWASGRSLDEVLRGTDLAAGDFVRRCKQIIDVLGQLKDQPDAALSRSARDAITAIRRGVVAADRLD